MKSKVKAFLIVLLLSVFSLACTPSSKKEKPAAFKQKEEHVKLLTVSETEEFKIEMAASEKGKKDQNFAFSRKSALYFYDLITAKEKLPLDEKKKLINILLKVMPKGRFTVIILKKSKNAFFGSIKPFSESGWLMGSLYIKGKRMGSWGFHLDSNGDPRQN